MSSLTICSPPHPPRGLEGIGANQLEEGEVLCSDGLARGAGERAGAMGFPGDMRRHSETLSDAFAASEIEHSPVPRGEREHVGELRPGEADAGEVACAVDRVDRAEALLVEPLGPSCRIIVNPNRAARAAHVDMMGEREIAEAKVPRDRPYGFGQLLFAGKLANVPDEFFYATEHPPRAAFRNAAGAGSKSAHTQGVLSCLAPPRQVSQALARRPVRPSACSSSPHLPRHSNIFRDCGGPGLARRRGARPADSRI